LRPVPRKGRQVRVLYKTVTRRRHALILALLIAVVLLATACSSSATPSYSPPAEPVAIAWATLSAFPPSRCVSKGQRLRFEHISVEDGLSQDAAFAILRDSNESCEPTGVSGLTLAQVTQKVRMHPSSRGCLFRFDKGDFWLHNMGIAALSSNQFVHQNIQIS
jgi:hypothetical protein